MIALMLSLGSWFYQLKDRSNADFPQKDSSSDSDSSDSDESPERKGGLQSANQLLEKLAKMKEFAEKKRREMVDNSFMKVVFLFLKNPEHYLENRRSLSSNLTLFTTSHSNFK